MIALFTIFWTLLVAFGLFSLTVFIHELGHFIAGKWRGLVIERFAIGFGPKAIGWKHDGVEYVINWLPLGGFVQLPQMAAMDMVEGESSIDVNQLPPVSPWDKIITAFFGPLFSFGLALTLAYVVYAIGVPQDQNIITTTIGYVDPDSPADKAGVHPGDKVLSVAGQEVTRWRGRANAVSELIILHPMKTIEVELERPGGERYKVELERVPNPLPEFENLYSVGFEHHNACDAIIRTVHDEFPAKKAGLQEGDEIIRVNGTPIYSPYMASQLIRESGGPVDLTVLRDGEEKLFELLPQDAKFSFNGEVETRPMIGITWEMNNTLIVHLSPWEQIGNSATLVFRMLRALTSSGSGVKVQHMSGPIGIFNKIMVLLTVDWRLVVFFMVVLNVNLAILNLLPIPILDGGHILFSLIELARRRPLETAGVKALYALQVCFFFMLIALFLYVSFHDVRRFEYRTFFEQEPVKVELVPSQPSQPSQHNPPPIKADQTEAKE